LVGIMSSDIDVDKSNIGIVESRLGARSEISQPGPHADDEVSLTPDLAGTGSPCHGESAQIQRRGSANGSLSPEGFADGNAKRLREGLEFFPCLGIMHAATSHDHGASRLE